MRVYDVSLTVSPDLPVWPGDNRVELVRVEEMRAGGEANVTHLTMSAHAGTHVDAPYHFLSDGSFVEDISLKTLTGRAYVLHMPEADLIDAAALEQAGLPPRTRRVLFRTRNSEWWVKPVKRFRRDYVAISADGAEFLVEKGVKLVGVDYLSVAPYENTVPTHEVLLRAGVVIVEGLNLSQIAQGRYTFYCLPLKLAKSDGAPARAILIGV